MLVRKALLQPNVWMRGMTMTIRVVALAHLSTGLLTFTESCGESCGSTGFSTGFCECECECESAGVPIAIGTPADRFSKPKTRVGVKTNS